MLFHPLLHRRDRSALTLAFALAATGCMGAEAHDQLEPAQAALASGTPDVAADARRADGRSFEERALACRRDPRVTLGLVSVGTCIGAELFFREDFDGNGRTCGSCHPVNHNFTIDSAFIATLPDDDPLFVAEQDPALSELEISDILREHGLNRINPDGFDDPEHKFVMRSVPHMFSVATALVPPPSEPGAPLTIDETTLPPLERTGWSGDGAPDRGELADFTLGAIRQHAPRSLARVTGGDFRAPTDAERDAITQYMRELGRRNELRLADVRLADPAAERGRLSFIGGAAQECNDCHDNAGANGLVFDTDLNVGFVTNFSSDTGVEQARLAILNERALPHDGGFGRAPLDADQDGAPERFGNKRFNIPSLIEAADTAPFFHTNAAQTLEDVFRHYTGPAFAASDRGQSDGLNRPAGMPFSLTPEQLEELGRFLRVLNASFNCQLTQQRLDAALKIADAYGAQHEVLQQGLIQLAESELRDALRVLREKDALNESAQWQLEATRHAIEAARCARGSVQRRRQLQRALDAVLYANAALGEGLTLELGSGTVLF